MIWISFIRRGYIEGECVCVSENRGRERQRDRAWTERGRESSRAVRLFSTIYLSCHDIETADQCLITRNLYIYYFSSKALSKCSNRGYRKVTLPLEHLTWISVDILFFFMFKRLYLLISSHKRAVTSAARQQFNMGYLFKKFRTTMSMHSSHIRDIYSGHSLPPKLKNREEGGLMTKGREKGGKEENKVW